MKLQIKYNFIDIDQALAVAQQTADQADIVEVGSLLLLKYGVQAITRFKDMFPDKPLYADAKITDQSKEAVKLLSTSGVHYISVLAGTYFSIIKDATKAADDYGTHIILDFINTESLGQTALEAKNLGAQAILVHRARPPQGTLELENNWEEITVNTDLPIWIKGRVSFDVLPDLVKLKPHGFVIGSAITKAQDPAFEAQRIKDFLNKAPY